MLFNRPDTPQVPVSVGACICTHLIRGSLDPPVSAFQTASRSVQLFFPQLMGECLFTMGRNFVTHALGQPELKSQTTS